MYEKFANVYDELMYDFDYDEWARQVERVIRERLPDAKQGVDLACGSGNFTIRLASAGFRMIGSDLSPDMLRKAKEKSKGLPITYLCRDLNCAEFTHPVDFMTAMCDAVNYCVDGVNFAGLAKGLKKGGLLIFDISTTRHLSETLGNNFFFDDGEEVTYLWQNSFSDGLCTMDVSFFALQDDGLYERFDERHVLRAYSVEELRSALEPYFDVEIFDESLMQAPSADAERIHFVCTRKAF